MTAGASWLAGWESTIGDRALAYERWRRDSRPLIVHVIHRLQVGGLENGLLNLLDRLPRQRYRHAIISMTDYTDFFSRLERDDVPVFALRKRPGKDLGSYARLWRLLRELCPALVHTRNLATLEAAAVAFAAGVPRRVHGEHGRDMSDLDGQNKKYLALRKFCRHFVHHYIALSQDLARWLEATVKVPAARISHICNGVDSTRFHPGAKMPGAGPVVIGTVGRMEPVKNQLALAEAFIQLCRRPELAGRIRLHMIGDGSLLEPARRLLDEAGVLAHCWLPGNRDDIPELMRQMDVFVLPSLAEGISNTILEAMACGLPVVATATGGNPELVEEGVTGHLVAVNDTAQLADTLLRYIEQPDIIARHGRAARQRVERRYSLERMVEQYQRVYDDCLGLTMELERS